MNVKLKYLHLRRAMLSFHSEINSICAVNVLISLKTGLGV